MYSNDSSRNNSSNNDNDNNTNNTAAATATTATPLLPRSPLGRRLLHPDLGPPDPPVQGEGGLRHHLAHALHRPHVVLAGGQGEHQARQGHVVHRAGGGVQVGV